MLLLRPGVISKTQRPGEDVIIAQNLNVRIQIKSVFQDKNQSSMTSCAFWLKVCNQFSSYYSVAL